MDDVKTKTFFQYDTWIVVQGNTCLVDYTWNENCWAITERMLRWQSESIPSTKCCWSTYFFYKSRKLDIGIFVNFVFHYIHKFLLYLHHMILVNRKLSVSGCKILFQGCRLHRLSSFLMAQLKQSWQCWHFCILESLWKTLNVLSIKNQW